MPTVNVIGLDTKFEVGNPTITVVKGVTKIDATVNVQSINDSIAIGVVEIEVLKQSDAYRKIVLGQIDTLNKSGYYYAYSIVTVKAGVETIYSIFHKDEEPPQKVLLRKIHSTKEDGVKIVVDLKEVI
jgi:hypothetical protein